MHRFENKIIFKYEIIIICKYFSSITDPDVLKNEFNLTLTDLFRVQCKFYAYETNKSDCMPCIVFTPQPNWLLTTDRVSTY